MGLIVHNLAWITSPTGAGFEAGMTSVRAIAAAHHPLRSRVRLQAMAVGAEISFQTQHERIWHVDKPSDY